METAEPEKEEPGAMAKSVYVAQMETESFSWLSVGETEEQAKDAVLKRWNRNVKSQSEYYGTPYKKWDMETLESYYEVTVERVGMGECRMI